MVFTLGIEMHISRLSESFTIFKSDQLRLRKILILMSYGFNYSLYFNI